MQPFDRKKRVLFRLKFISIMLSSAFRCNSRFCRTSHEASVNVHLHQRLQTSNCSYVLIFWGNHHNTHGTMQAHVDHIFGACMSPFFTSYIYLVAYETHSATISTNTARLSDFLRAYTSAYTYTYMHQHVYVCINFLYIHT
jgi:hypothetical protein